MGVGLMGVALVRPVSAVAWELRGAWATGRRVALTLQADVQRVEGVVTSVSPTGAHCTVDGWHVPLHVVLAVHLPSRLGDSSWRHGQLWAGARPEVLAQVPGQQSLGRIEGG